MISPVPAEYHGVWRRNLLKTRTGINDDTTQVFWLQTDSMFGDLRLPTTDPSAKLVRSFWLGQTFLPVLLHDYQSLMSWGMFGLDSL